MEAMVLVIWDPLGKEYGHLPSRTLTTPKWRDSMHREDVSKHGRRERSLRDS